MAAKQRVYVVTERAVGATGGVVESLVSAGSQAQAIAAVVDVRFEAKPASGAEVARLMGAGVAVIEGGAV